DLAGKPGAKTIVRTPLGQAVDVIKNTPPRQGKAVFTTLDRTIQAYAESVLRQTVAKWHAKDAVAVAIDPSTGGVLAMAQAPGYNANNANRVAQEIGRASCRE